MEMDKKLHVMSYTLAAMAGVSLICGLAILSGDVRL